MRRSGTQQTHWEQAGFRIAPFMYGVYEVFIYFMMIIFSLNSIWILKQWLRHIKELMLAVNSVQHENE